MGVAREGCAGNMSCSAARDDVAAMPRLTMAGSTAICALRRAGDGRESATLARAPRTSRTGMRLAPRGAAPIVPTSCRVCLNYVRRARIGRGETTALKAGRLICGARAQKQC